MDNGIQLFKEPKIKPTNELIAKGLGLSYDSYINLIEKMKQESITLMNWRYYNDGKVWFSKGEYNWITSRGTNKVKPIFWTSIWKGFFRINFFFSENLEIIYYLYQLVIKPKIL